MFKDVVKYEDFDGNVKEATVYFNLSRMEALELMADHNGEYDNYLQSVVETGNHRLIIDTFSDFVKKAYGIKSEDGTRFIKSSEITEEFVQSAVYDEFMMKLVQSEDYVRAFVSGVIPKGVQSVNNAS